MQIAAASARSCWKPGSALDHSTPVGGRIEGLKHAAQCHASPNVPPPQQPQQLSYSSAPIAPLALPTSGLLPELPIVLLSHAWVRDGCWGCPGGPPSIQLAQATLCVNCRPAGAASAWRVRQEWSGRRGAPVIKLARVGTALNFAYAWRGVWPATVGSQRAPCKAAALYPSSHLHRLPAQKEAPSIASERRHIDSLHCRPMGILSCFGCFGGDGEGRARDALQVGDLGSTCVGYEGALAAALGMVVRWSPAAWSHGLWTRASPRWVRRHAMPTQHAVCSLRQPRTLHRQAHTTLHGHGKRAAVQPHTWQGQLNCRQCGCGG